MKSLLQDVRRASWLVLKLVIILYLMNSHDAFFLYQNF
jgi:hypothetical protein